MYCTRHFILIGFALSALTGTAGAEPLQPSIPTGICKLTQLTARLDDRNGEFNGMSQSGTLLILRNTGKAPCRLSALPALGFEGIGHRALTVKRRIPRGMDPGPVLLPVTVAAGQEVNTRLHWVDGDVFAAGNCVKPAFITLAMKGGSLRVPFGAMMCAAAGENAYFDQAPLSMME